MEHLRHIHLHIIIVRCIDSHAFLGFLHYNLLLNSQIHQILLDILYFHFQQLAGAIGQRFLFQIHMAFVHAL